MVKGVKKPMNINEHDLEQAALLPDRYYIVMQNIDDDGFSCICYDTTGIDPTEGDNMPPVGAMVQEGILELMNTSLEKIMQTGLAVLTAKYAAQMDEETKEEYEDNIIRVDFGMKQ
jgi:hypothetical protein